MRPSEVRATNPVTMMRSTGVGTAARRRSFDASQRTMAPRSVFSTTSTSRASSQWLG